MNKFSNKGAQGGFTLIVLIVVIVILGILAATALPKFANLGGDARAASLQAAKGAMTSTAAMVHGKYLMNPGAIQTTNTMAIEGTTVTIDKLSGYPVGNKNFATASGMNAADYDIDDTTTAGSVVVTPISLKGTTQAATCKLTYKGPVTANALPTYTTVVTGC